MGLYLIFTYFNALFKQRWVLWSLFVINLLGTIYGYYWYRYQMASTPLELLPFVPDSPTASLFFTLVLFLLLHHARSSFVAAFAAVTSIKYGIWAVAAIVWGASLGDTLNLQHFMLIASHLGMAVEAILFYRFYRIQWHHLAIVGLWAVLNDYVDYTFDVHPWTAAELDPYITQLGWFTFALSVFSITLVAYLVIRQRKEDDKYGAL